MVDTRSKLIKPHESAQLNNFFSLNSEFFKVDTPYHIHHKHHVERVPEVKYIKVPVEKEVKIPEPYKVPIKIKVRHLLRLI